MINEPLPWEKEEYAYIPPPKKNLSLERANTKIINYAYEMEYADKIIRSLYEYIVEVKLSKAKTNRILDEIAVWKKRKHNITDYIKNCCIR